MHKAWIPILNSCGWEYHDLGLPTFSKLREERLYFCSRPDTSVGIIPNEIDLSTSEKREIHDYFNKYSQNIYIGDLLNTWNFDCCKKMAIDYQVIPKIKQKLEKDTRNAISQAKRFGVNIEQFDKDGYWDCIRETHARQDRYDGSRYVYDRICQYFNGIVAKHDGRVIAGCIYVIEEDKLRLLSSASRTEDMKFRPNHLIYERLIEIAGDREIMLGNAPKELEGLKKFKESFGAELKTFNVKFHED